MVRTPKPTARADRTTRGGDRRRAPCGLGRRRRPRGYSLDALSQRSVLTTPRRIWSSSIDSNRALKLPSPKPSSPLRWMISKKIGPITVLVKICSSRPPSGPPSSRIRLLAQSGQVFAVAGQPLVDQFVVGVRRVEELGSAARSASTVAVDVAGAQRDVLDALAVVRVQVLLDLPLPLRALLVDRDADLAAGAGHRLRFHAGRLALDVEVADLAEVEQALVEVRPLLHAPAMHVVGEVVDFDEPGACVTEVLLRCRRIDRLEVDVVDRDVADAAGAPVLAAPAVDEVDQGVADALDRGDVQLHRAGFRVECPMPRGRAPGDSAAAASRTRKAIAQIDGPCRRAKRCANESGSGVDDEVDAALTVKGDVLVAVSCDRLEAHLTEQPAERRRVRRRVFDELESVGAHGVIPAFESHLFSCCAFT